jgi:hypothetical protein
MAEDIVRVVRVYEFVGQRSWVEETVARAIHGTRVVGWAPGNRITGVTLGMFPDVLDAARQTPLPEQLADLQHTIDALQARLAQHEQGEAKAKARVALAPAETI